MGSYIEFDILVLTQVFEREVSVHGSDARRPPFIAGRQSTPDFELGYGYQWGLMDSDEGEFSAIGVYNQFIYINPTRSVVIVKT